MFSSMYIHNYVNIMIISIINTREGRKVKGSRATMRVILYRCIVKGPSVRVVVGINLSKIKKLFNELRPESRKLSDKKEVRTKKILFG